MDSQSVAENILRDLAQEIHNHGGRVKIIGRLPMVMANPTVLEQALTNLIMNALKYTNDGESPMVAVRSQEQGDMARIVVEDYGVGIAPEHLEKLFKPFERLSGKKPGTGLGLSIVAKGIQRMGGRVGVESTPGKGSRFWFELPRA